MDEKTRVMATVSEDGLWLAGAQRLKANRAIVMAAVKQNGMALQYASKPLQANRNVVLAAVKQNGFALRIASMAMRSDRAIVDAAVAQNKQALQFAFWRVKREISEEKYGSRTEPAAKPGDDNDSDNDSSDNDSDDNDSDHAEKKEIGENVGALKKRKVAAKKNKAASAKEKTAPKKAKVSSKKTKDPNAPKKPMSAFFYFMAHTRAATKAENPTATNGEVSTILGLKWKGLSEEDKATFNDAAAEAKDDYKIAFAKYSTSSGSDVKIASAGSDDED
jgi:hypothetical protein